MKLDFEDKIERDSVDLSFTIDGDNLERSIYVQQTTFIKWSLRVKVERWGIDHFNYELIEMRMPITIDTITEEGKKDSADVNAEVKYNSSAKHRGYICRIYEDILENDEWKEVEYAKFPIKITVDEHPTNSEANRSQLYVKYIELDLSSEERKLVLSI